MPHTARTVADRSASGAAIANIADKKNDPLFAEILLKQPGISVMRARPWLDTVKQTDGYLDTILEVADKSGKNPLISILDHAMRSYVSGHNIDPNPGNMIISPDGNSLRLIDQFDPYYKGELPEDACHDETVHLNHLNPIILVDFCRRIKHSSVHACEWSYSINLGFIPAEVQRKINRFDALLTAAEHVIENKYFGDRSIIPKPYHFEPMDKPELAFKVDGESAPITVKAVALSDPPHRLVEQLRGLQRLALSENIERLP